jgi:ribonuclease P/MRP protein subunit RPP40
VAGMIKRTFTYRDKETILQLYKALVRPRLEYCIQVWRPHFQKDIDLMEKVQRRATRLIVDHSDKPYHERLAILRLTTLETRRLRGDLIEVFKIMKGFENVDCSKFFDRSSTGLGGQSKIRKEKNLNLDIRNFFLSENCK